MVGEFFSGGVCQKENGENCSAEAAMDGKSKAALCVLFCAGLARVTQSRCSFEFEMCRCMRVSRDSQSLCESSHSPSVCVSASLYV